MLVLPTAKVLLFIALHLGPSHAQEIYATSNSESYVLTVGKTGGWVVEGKGFPASDYTRDPTKFATLDCDPSPNSVPAYLRPVASQSWRHDNAMVFDNGDRVEKHGDHAFFIINAGGANEKVFTIFYPTACK
jgi:hypothetical protein